VRLLRQRYSDQLFTHCWRLLCLFAGCALSGLLIGSHLNAMAQSCPQTPTPTISSPQPPNDVCIPDGFAGLPIDYFDDYSWRAFIALIWPTLSGQRGTPDTAKTPGDSGPRVFETYKALWEIFHPDGSAPSSSSFNDYERAQFNTCKESVGFGDLVLASFSKFSDLGQAGFGSLLGPIADQHGHYVRYLILYNSSEFNFIEDKALFLRSKIPSAATAPDSAPALQFPDGSIDIKAAWIDMAGFSDAQRGRYYTRPAIVLDPQSGKCSISTVGLVGLHIVQKTPTRPQWIWSTFEQIDNVPPAEPGSPGAFAFNDGNPAQSMPASNPLPLDPLDPHPTPFDIVRISSAPIHPNTIRTNAKYRSLLSGSVWKNYQLVMIQWPVGNGSQPVPATQTGGIKFTFPGLGATSAFANTTLETFQQGNSRTGCMNCHNLARGSADFVWSLLDHAFPPCSSTPDLFISDPRFRELMDLLQSAKRDLRSTAARTNGRAARRRKPEKPQ
jgi:hypothetical protein